MTRYFGTGRAGITSALFFLKIASEYKNWAELRAEEPSEKERSQIQLLKDEIEVLKVEKGRVTEKLDAIKKLILQEPENDNDPSSD